MVQLKRDFQSPLRSTRLLERSNVGPAAGSIGERVAAMALTAAGWAVSAPTRVHNDGHGLFDFHGTPPNAAVVYDVEVKCVHVASTVLPGMGNIIYFARFTDMKTDLFTMALLGLCTATGILYYKYDSALAVGDGVHVRLRGRPGSVEEEFDLKAPGYITTLDGALQYMTIELRCMFGEPVVEAAYTDPRYADLFAHRTNGWKACEQTPIGRITPAAAGFVFEDLRRYHHTLNMADDEVKVFIPQAITNDYDFRLGNGSRRRVEVKSGRLSYNASPRIPYWSIRFHHINPALSDVTALVLVAPHGLYFLDHDRTRREFTSRSKKRDCHRAGCNGGDCEAIDIHVHGNMAMEDPDKAATQCMLKLLLAGAKFCGFVSFHARTDGHSTNASTASPGKFTIAFARDWASELGCVKRIVY